MSDNIADNSKVNFTQGCCYDGGRISKRDTSKAHAYDIEDQSFLEMLVTGSHNRLHCDGREGLARGIMLRHKAMRSK